MPFLFFLSFLYPEKGKVHSVNLPNVKTGPDSLIMKAQGFESSFGELFLLPSVLLLSSSVFEMF